MTLAELLTECKNTRKHTPIRVFVGCMTIFNGTVSVMSLSQWIKLYPYFKCKVLNKRMINDTFVVTI